jgi:hypothetical protein
VLGLVLGLHLRLGRKGRVRVREEPIYCYMKKTHRNLARLGLGSGLGLRLGLELEKSRYTAI